MTTPFFWKEESFLRWRRADGVRLALGVHEGRLTWVVDVPFALVESYGLVEGQQTYFSVKEGDVSRALKYVDQLYSPSPAMRKHMPVDWLGSPTDQISRM